MLEKLSHNFRTALESLSQNKLRAFLTSLGIIFGVASVISMMAIGRGAREEVLQQLATLGSHNVIVMAKTEDPEEAQTQENEGIQRTGKRFSPGLSLKDAESIETMIPGVVRVCPEVSKDLGVLYEGRKAQARLVGVTGDFFTIGGFSLGNGNLFTNVQELDAAPVCIIGQELKTRLFTSTNPLGKQIKVGRVWLTVIGVAESRVVTGSSQDLGVHDFRMEVFIPIKSFLLRYQDRSRFTLEEQESMFRMMIMDDDEEQKPKGPRNYHQVDKITVIVADNSKINEISSIVDRMLNRRHNSNDDYRVVVPEMLLKQEQETQATFGIVLISIASISLLVGGIGIMNIMLASVMERIKEIGVRLALGATKRDIILQFLSEAVTISLVGGIIGIFAGLTVSWLIEQFTGVMTIVTPLSVLLAFFVSISVGIAFGIFPARKAAMQDPVVSLRYE